MQKTEILDFVIRHIAENGRAVNNNAKCVYYTEDGKRCAHSICLNDEIAKEAYGSADLVIIKYGDEAHKPEFRGCSIEFWLDIQDLHDDKLNCNGKELSKQGIEKVEELKEKYS